MTRNEKFQEIFSNKLLTKEKTYLIGEDFHLEGEIIDYSLRHVGIQTKTLGYFCLHFDNITTII